ncbi:haloacid dehalogenase type II [Thermodesulfatator atlanticus]|uniref:haloacid dehalogenase type II n=1 Tax=Thermodesulfatator atlanticus TaxID=501497 RepID=UPI0003B45A4B|nr:haloacid dehalogenase type II [Thermodesulfatator atlanticus]
MRFKWVSFDCYGTLIDWEKGIISALSPYLAMLQSSPTEREILRLYARLESLAEKTWKPYRLVLEEVAQGMFQTFGLTVTKEMKELFWRTLPSWKPFPEVKAALLSLKSQGFKIAIISNIDPDLLEKSLEQIGASFDELVTAYEARCYKPYPEIFALAEKKFSSAPQEIFHVAQSLFHDVAPARQRGWTTCWVRRPGRDTFGATPKAEAFPDYTVSSLAEIPELLKGLL